MKLHYPLAQFDVQSVSSNGKLDDVRMFNLVRCRFSAAHISPSAAQSWLSEKYSQPRSREVIAVTQLPFAAGRAPARIALSQELRFRLVPFADDRSPPFAIHWPFLGEAVVRNIVGFDTERVLDDLGRSLAVVAVDCLFQKIGHVGLTRYRPRLPPVSAQNVTASILRQTTDWKRIANWLRDVASILTSKAQTTFAMPSTVR